MKPRAWQTDNPPNEQVVEVEYGGKIIRVRAIWGRDGTLPHWEEENRNRLWHPSAFQRWRPISADEGRQP